MRLFLIPLVMFVSSVALATPEIPVELKGVGIEEKLGAQVDLNLKFQDEKGSVVPLRSVIDGRKPTLLFIVYYSCPSLCNFFLNGALEVLKKVSLSAGKDFNILTVSMDPRETHDLAEKKKKSYLEVYGRPSAQEGWRFWVSDAPIAKIPADMYTVGATTSRSAAPLTSVRALADQVGFRYRYDKDDDQFAHSAAMVVLTPEGKVSRYLYGIGFQPRDLRLAVVEAGGNKIGNVVDRLLLFCFHYDPKARKYGLFISNLMRASAALVTLMLGTMIAVFFWRDKKVSETRIG